MELDPGLDLVRVRGPVRNDSIDLGSGDDSIGGELVGRIFDRFEVVDPHRDLPRVGPSDQPSATAGRTITERDHRVLVATGALLGISSEAIGQALASRTGAQTQAFGEAVVEADGHIHGHAYSVARCQQVGGGVMEFIALDAAGHRRSPATMPGYHDGRSPRNKGMRYPADPPTIEEIVAVMRVAGERPDGLRLRALIVLLWRAGLRIGEALALAETDLDRSRGAVLVRRGKGGKRREVGMDRWAWQQLDPWLELRPSLPVGALLCVIHGTTAGRHWEASAAASN